MNIRKIPRKEIVDSMKVVYPKGCRVMLDRMNDPQAAPVGTLGTVACVDDAGTIHVNWDNGSTLGIVYEEDKCHRV